MSEVRIPITPQLAITPRTLFAYNVTLPETQSMADSDLTSINRDVGSTLATVFAAVPRMRAFRPQLAQLPGFDIERFDKIEQYALALGHSHALYRSAGASPPGDLTEKGTEVVALRDRLLTDAENLANYGLLDGAQLKECKTANGYKPAAVDIITIVTLMTAAWPQIEGKTPATLESLNAANDKAIGTLNAIGDKDQEKVADVALTRQRLFTLLTKAYEDARHAIAFIRRREDDADSIAPSLFAGRNTRPSKSDDHDPPAPTPVHADQGDNVQAGAQSAEPPKAEPPKAEPPNAEVPKPFHMVNGPNLPLTSPFRN